MVPRSVMIIDTMPLNPNGKMAKPMLRKLVNDEATSESRTG